MTKHAVAGITIDKKNYCCLSARPQALIGRNSKQTVSIGKCRTAIVIGIHEQKTNSNAAHTLITKLASYLIEQKL